jgi:SNF2 family DNA or RNA helicase
MDDKSSIKSINKFTINETIILEIISIAYKGLSFKRLLNYYNDFPSQGLEKVSKETLKSLVLDLINKNIIIEDHKLNFLCDPTIEKLMFRSSLENNRFNQISNLIKYDIVNNKKLREEEDIYCYFKIQLFRGTSDLNSSLSFLESPIKNISLELILENIIDDILESFDLDFIEKSNIHENYKTKIYYQILHLFLSGKNFDFERVEYVGAKLDSLDLNSIGLLKCIYYIINDERYTLLNNKYPDETNIHFEIWYKLLNKNSINLNKKEKSLLHKDPQKNIFRDYRCILYFLFLLKEGNQDNYSGAFLYLKYISNLEKHPYLYEIQACKDFLDFISSEDEPKPIFNNNIIKSNNYWSILIFLLLSFWINRPIDEKSLEYIEKYAENLRTYSHEWFSSQIFSLLQSFSNSKDSNLNSEGFFLFKDIYIGMEKWERVLKSLKEFLNRKQMTSKSRIIWEIKYNIDLKSIDGITPIEQILSSSYEWTSQKEIQLKSLFLNPEKYPYLSSNDLQIIQNIKREIIDVSGSYSYSFNLDSLEFLVDKPNIYDHHSKFNVHISKKIPKIRLFRNMDNSINISIFPSKNSARNTIVIPESENSLYLYTYSDDLNKIYELISNTGVSIPSIGETELSHILSLLSEYIPIQSEVNSDIFSNSIEVEADKNLTIEIRPYNNGISIHILSKPFGVRGDSFFPFSDAIKVYMNIDDRNIKVIRDFQLEKFNFNLIINNCSTLTKAESKSQFHYILENPEDALELINEFNGLTSNIVLEYPIGNKFTILGKINEDNFKIYLHRYKDYYRLSGVIELDPLNSFDIELLLSKLPNSIGRFLYIKENNYLSISTSLKNTLLQLKSLSISSNTELLYSPIMIFILKGLLSKFSFIKFDDEWKKIDQEYQISQKFIPELPSEFKADLRSYQKEGFIWMMKLFKCGAGACLADDMGLGKTIQALSVIQLFSETGPTLIITPTSVISNWESEIKKNCIGITVKSFGSNYREKVALSIQAKDVLICSYGLLQQKEISTLLSKIKWKTIVLDEAQMIKNIHTKRSLAIMNLKADIRIATTGTPIENHLSELWNLFNFLNPTLLGTKEKYRKDYVLPIKKDNNLNVLQNLKAIVSPFILRRLKIDVLPELPPKTEIVVEVELSDSETLFYESIRNHALSKISDPLIPINQKQIQIFAEIMRLRRACCNTKLVDKDSTISSSKFIAFTNILKDLLENKHRALIFSQFVDHLAIVKNFLSSKGISYQYLDGSTPSKDRAKIVDLFQKGGGDVFLISLRAGGTGLNLTSADYVIHLDPWWNPAIEDQASDRAYRFGQTKPVTVYKFITKNTIEERIYTLHSQKRELANMILNDTKDSASLSIEDLYHLIENINN